ncbi:hypothetical protein [Engelhardtia mirabilis]|uniref:Chromosome partition protein Smc n=1 Tax=Engelhardtia mirabilis TaxID=2528011 RepID=A0A518BE44_9BACT|nr:hypothetical protein Pla133_03050 [Planctomycetes bacterium Pla133]QDU99567.1 hypothetical protein Pla86_03050 [Planctomycetes bacterium Pla86]
MRRRASTTVLLWVSLAAASCVSVPEGQRLSSKVEGQHLSQRELRIRLYDFVVRFSSAVETAADEIVARTESHAVRERALLWKTGAVPACESAAFDADPLVGFVDVWTLVAQMGDYFEGDEGAADFGDLVAVARRVAVQLEREVESIGVDLQGAEGAAAMGAAVRSFAGEHPLDAPVFVRPAELPVYDLAERASTDGLLEVAATADERLAEAQDRITIYAASLPRQARWQAELLGEQLLGRPEVAALTGLAKQVPTLVAAERGVILAALSAERAAMVEAADAQRLDTLEFARGEREASIASLDDQRLATLEALSAERVAVLEDIDRQREATLAHLKSEREQTLEWFASERNASIDYASDATARTGERILGRAFLYALALIVVPTLLLVIAIAVVRPKLTVDFSRPPTSRE